MSKFTVKIMSDRKVDLLSCNSIRVIGRKLHLHPTEHPQDSDYASVTVASDEAAYIENASGKTVYSLYAESQPER